MHNSTSKIIDHNQTNPEYSPSLFPTISYGSSTSSPPLLTPFFYFSFSLYHYISFYIVYIDRKLFSPSPSGLSLPLWASPTLTPMNALFSSVLFIYVYGISIVTMEDKISLMALGRDHSHQSHPACIQGHQPFHSNNQFIPHTGFSSSSLQPQFNNLLYPPEDFMQTVPQYQHLPMMQIASQHAKHEFASASNSTPSGFEYLLYNGVFDTPEGNEWLQSQVAVQQHHHQGEMVGSVSNIMPGVTVQQQPDCLLGVIVQQPPDCSLRRRTNVGSCSGSASLDSQVTASSKEPSKKEKRMIKNRESAARSRAKKQAHIMKLEQDVKNLKFQLQLKQKDVDFLERTVKPPQPRYQLRRTMSTLN
ncbi:ABSCISIC ACID-INSENSITIVE 5-like protein 2 [Acorus gramineus]|uniref:ABSCISIC ACID-INSENSITIVE 5-like protein 2 n=1 Tax=Acorus gramineus TaxID=55184 RepID=A0AAV9BRM4_ACOGR|nr:ABSCISIC ACID-INSENSITIVE 5-like protein 2 [Acorus gramineus]